RLRTFTCRAAGVLQGGVIRLHALELLVGFGQLVGDHQGRHDGEPRIADLAELAAQRDDALVELPGELLQMALLAVLAGHAELAAIDGDIHLRHGTLMAATRAPDGYSPSPHRAGGRSRGSPTPGRAPCPAS